MRLAYSLFLGAALVTRTYAAEPTLQTVPDAGFDLVQENADKALKVAYIVAGKSCSVGSTSGGSVTKIPFSGEREQYSANLTLDNADKTYDFTLVDRLDVSGFFDYLTLVIYRKGVPVKKTRMDIVDSIQILDGGFDGHINMGSDGRTNKLYAQTLSAKGETEERGKEHEPYFQDLYLKALDAVIARCEAKQ